MWKITYICVVLGGTVLATANSIVSTVGGDQGFAFGYVALILFGSATMLLVGFGMFKEKKEETKE